MTWPASGAGEPLHGRAAIVTGGGLSGAVANVGHAICVALARAGCHIVVADIDAVGAQATVQAIEQEGRKATSTVMDVTDEADCARCVAEATDAFGRLDVLVNNVAVADSRKPIETATEDEWDRIMSVNLKGALFMTKHALPVLRTGGAIVNISSSRAHRPAAEGSGAYAASKAGLESFTRAVAVQAAPRGVRANCVSPGQVWTAMVVRNLAADQVDAVREGFRLASLLKTEGTAWDVADAVTFLAWAPWVTGQILAVDGGAPLLRQPSLPPLDNETPHPDTR